MSKALSALYIPPIPVVGPGGTLQPTVYSPPTRPPTHTQELEVLIKLNIAVVGVFISTMVTSHRRTLDYRHLECLPLRVIHTSPQGLT